MSKTVQQLAERFSKVSLTKGADPHSPLTTYREGLYEGFIAGYEAGATDTAGYRLARERFKEAIKVLDKEKGKDE